MRHHATFKAAAVLDQLTKRLVDTVDRPEVELRYETLTVSAPATHAGEKTGQGLPTLALERR
jgi:hypothetical protein